MALTSEFIPLELGQLRREAAIMKADGWRFMQTHAVNSDVGIDLYYSFMKDGHVLNYRIEGVTKDQPVPSITDLFLAAFVFENEARELFGVDMRDIAIDFHGAMYAPAQSEPMTFVTPEQKAAKKKAAKAAAAKAAKEAAAKAQAAGGAEANGTDVAHAPSATSAATRRVFVMTPERQARLDAKMASLSDEKKAKVQAALAARAEEAAASGGDAAAPAVESVADKGEGVPGESACSAKTEGRALHQQTEAEASAERADADRALADALTLMDPAKAAKVRAVLEGRAGQPVSADESPVERLADEQIEELLRLMGDEKAAKVRTALAREGGE